MIYPFVPKRSGVHRIAGIALFRALLIKCRQSSFDGETKDALENVVRHRFKKNRHVCSKRLLSVAFQGGYEALDLLDASAAGDVASISKIQSVLKRIPASMKRAPEPSPLLPKKPPRAKTFPSGPKPYSSVLSRPHPTVSGKRHVPKLVVWAGMPFLRIKKPQPHHLTGLLAKGQRRKEARLAFIYEVEDTLLPMAQQEDEWDMLLEEEFGAAVKDKRPAVDRGSWEDGITFAKKCVSGAMYDENKKHQRMAFVLYDIVKKEEELARKEELDAASAAGPELDVKVVDSTALS